MIDADAALANISDQFDAHKCKPIDSSQDGLRIVRESTRQVDFSAVLPESRGQHPSFWSSLLTVSIQDEHIGDGLGGTMTDVEGFPQGRTLSESRRSTRVRLKILIETQGIAEPRTCQGETIVVNRHGALISTAVSLRVGIRIEIRVIPTDKRALADVVYVDPDQPRVCGIGLVKPENIWGLSLPPKDWHEDDM